MAGEQQGDQEPAAGQRVLVRARREPGRLPVHVPSPDTRLWRKNLRDNNGNGTTEVGDGVDPNRNYPEHWNYDNEGSSGVASSDTYRGPAEESEPETQAITGLYDRIDFAFHVNYHSAGQWLLYPEGWQIGAPTADDPIYFALSGNLDNPAIDGLPSGSLVRRPLRHERRDDRFRPCAARDARVDARAVGGLPELRIRVPGRRGARAG